MRLESGAVRLLGNQTLNCTGPGNCLAPAFSRLSDRLLVGSPRNSETLLGKAAETVEFGNENACRWGNVTETSLLRNTFAVNASTACISYVMRIQSEARISDPE